jgi:hypothetical protein
MASPIPRGCDAISDMRIAPRFGVGGGLKPASALGVVQVLSTMAGGRDARSWLREERWSR